MKCPMDGSELRISERSGIEIDYCPQCRGIWLDRGELDKLIERAADYEVRPAQVREKDRYYDYDDDDDRRYYNQQGKRKRRSFLEDVFDILD